MGTNARDAEGRLNQALADEIRAERARQRLTQADVIERSGVPRATYNRLENAERAIDVEQLNAIAAALNIMPSVLVQRAEGALPTGAA